MWKDPKKFWLWSEAAKLAQVEVLLPLLQEGQGHPVLPSSQRRCGCRRGKAHYDCGSCPEVSVSGSLGNSVQAPLHCMPSRFAGSMLLDSLVLQFRNKDELRLLHIPSLVSALCSLFSYQGRHVCMQK